MALSISAWSKYTQGCPKLHKKGELSVESGRVLIFVYDGEHMHVTAVVQASMRDKSYSLDVSTFLLFFFHADMVHC